MARVGDDDKGAARRRRRGFVPAGHGARAMLVEGAARFGFAEPQLLTHWPDVVGPGLAGRCRPVRVVYGRGKDLSRTLVVAADDGGAAMEVEYRAIPILARVNERYGYGAITRLVVDQSGARGKDRAEAGPRSRGEPVPETVPPEDARAAAEAAAAPVADEGLRAALRALGTYILSEPRRDDGAST